MPSAEYEAFRAAMPPGQPDPNDPPEVVREKMHAIHPTTCRPGTHIEQLTLGGVEANWVYAPEHAETDRFVFHVHGGAFVSTVLQHYHDYDEQMSREIGARVLCAQYRWAPEHRYPAALDDVLAAYRGLLATGIDPARVAFIGDSCGGGLGLSAIVALRDAGEPLPACLVGLTPWLDADQGGDSARHPRGEDPFVEPDWIRARFRDYAGDADPRQPSISPIHASLDGLPPIYLSVGGIDTTADDSLRLAERARREGGATVIVDVAGDMIHGFVGLCGQFPEATEAMGRVAGFVRACVP